MYIQMCTPAKSIIATTKTSTPNPQLDPITQSTLTTMQSQILSLQKQLDELESTVQPLLPLAEAIEKHASELQSAKLSFDGLAKQLAEVVPTIMQIAPMFPKIISMTESLSPGSFSPPTALPSKTSSSLNKVKDPRNKP